MYWLFPNATTGPILLIRAFEFERLFGWDLEILDLRNDKQTVRVAACSGKELLCRQEGADGTSREKTEFEKSIRTSSSSAQIISFYAG